VVGDIFVRMAGILKIYTEYIQNFNEALSQIQVHSSFPMILALYIAAVCTAEAHASPILMDECRVQECKKSIVFLEFCNQAFPKFSFSVVDLPSLLITPIQRIPRYQLLLKDLLKHTWPVPFLSLLHNILVAILHPRSQRSPAPRTCF
jgi:hypothetical protein